MQNRRDNINFYDEQILPQDFHMPGIEPWIAGILKRHQLNFILDLGSGIGFWGYLIKSYVARGSTEQPKVIGVDLDIEKLSWLKKMNLYDEVVRSDIRYLPFRDKSFDTIMAIESLYFKDFWNSLDVIEALSTDGGLIILSRGLSEDDRRELIKRGYDVYHVYLRGLMLRRINDGKDLFSDAKLKRLAFLIKIFYKVFKPKAKDYIIALKVQDHGGK
jgi:SAM-dependent methyltransferase